MSSTSIVLCQAEPCVLSDKSKERDKRIVVCSSPGCEKQFHAACIGQAKKSDKELSNLFFVCLRCEAYLKYSAEIAHKLISSELDAKLTALKESIHETIEEKITNERALILEQTNSLFDSFSRQFEDKLGEVKRVAADAERSVHGLLKVQEKSIQTLQTEFLELKNKCLADLNGAKSGFDSIQSQVASLESKKRKKAFIVRNFPEKPCIIRGKTISNCQEALFAISQELDLEVEAGNIKDVFRLGKPREDGKPRLMMVKTSEKIVRMFLSKSRLLKNAVCPLNKVFLQEDLPVEVNRKLAAMRKRAYEHRTKHPGEEAYVRNKKLVINGMVVEEIEQHF